MTTWFSALRRLLRGSSRDIRSPDALANLRVVLGSAGFREDAPDPDTAWRAFNAFAAIPVDVSDDALLFECGVFEFTGRPLFHWSLTRQLTHEVRGEHEGMEQVHLAILYEPVPALASLETTLWSYDFPSFAEWARAVEALPEFAAASGHRPAGCELYQEEV